MCVVEFTCRRGKSEITSEKVFNLSVSLYTGDANAIALKHLVIYILYQKFQRIKDAACQQSSEGHG